MKKFIETLIAQKEDFSAEQILTIFSKIGTEGDIIILKNDGIRHANNFSVIITSGINAFDSIRNEGENLTEILKEALQRYYVNKD